MYRPTWQPSKLLSLLGHARCAWRFWPVGRARMVLGRTADVGWAQLRPFAIIQSLFQLVQMLQVRNYKTQPSFWSKILQTWQRYR
jgi:hypothetical protein